MTDDLVKRLRRNITNGWPDDVDLQACNEAADRIEALEARNKLLEQSQAAQALAGLGVNVVAAHNSGLAALKAGCKEERLRAEKAEARIEALEAALRQICDGQRDADKSYAELFAEVCWEARAALGEKKDG